MGMRDHAPSWRSRKLVRRTSGPPGADMQHSPRQGLSRQSARSSRPQSARVSARPSSARPTEENRQPYVLSINCPPEELPNYGLKYTAPYPVQPGRPSSARSSRISSPRATVRAQPPLTNARVFPPRGFEPAGYKKPWAGLDSEGKLPWMRYGAGARDRKSTSEDANVVPNIFYRQEMEKFKAEAMADGVMDEKEKVLMGIDAKDRDLAWMKKTPDVRRRPIPPRAHVCPR